MPLLGVLFSWPAAAGIGCCCEVNSSWEANWVGYRVRVPLRAHAMGNDPLAIFLEEASLSAYQPQLVALGVAVPADIADVEGASSARADGAYFIICLICTRDRPSEPAPGSLRRRSRT
jgi:hypothetical protein